MILYNFPTIKYKLLHFSSIARHHTTIVIQSFLGRWKAASLSWSNLPCLKKLRVFMIKTTWIYYIFQWDQLRQILLQVDVLLEWICNLIMRDYLSYIYTNSKQRSESLLYNVYTPNTYQDQTFTLLSTEPVIMYSLSSSLFIHASPHIPSSWTMNIIIIQSR